MPDLNDLMAPDMQKVLFFLLPTLAALSTLVMNMTRGFTTPGIVLTLIFSVVAIFYAPDFFSLF